MLTCREFDDFMADYLAKELPLRRRLDCWLHVSLCSACRKYLREYRRTIALGKQVFFEHPDHPVPDSVPDSLVRAALMHRRKDRSRTDLAD